MKKCLFYIITTSMLFVGVKSYSQNENKTNAIFIEPKNEFYEEITKEIEKFNTPAKVKKRVMKVDFTGMDLPKSLSEFTSYWHTPPVSQGMTGTCWAFSTTSFFESEIYRLNKKEIKLSVLFTVYWEYVEKTRRFIQERGNSAFAEGSEANAVPRIYKEYGAVPLDAYKGLLPGQVFHDHSKMYDEMNSYLQTVKENNEWNEEEAISTVKDIMNHYLGIPPSKVNYDGEEYTPKEFFKKVVNLKLDDYVDIVSYSQEPFNQKVEYTVPDNWWHSKNYYNVPLETFMKIVKNAIRNGYTLAIGGDVSEPGYDSHSKCAIIPTFDIPSEYIDDNARELRFSNGSTADDHGIHLVGYMTKNGKDWYLIKDSGAGSKNVEPKGYYFYNEDYVKLKIMDFMVHKDALGNLIEVRN
jgi:bleomycin hydrolase